MFANFISWIVFGLCLFIQICYIIRSYKRLSSLKSFFPNEKNYEVIEHKGEISEIIINSENTNSELKSLVDELNEYINKNKGTTDFSIIQNKVERRINLLYEDATSKIGFPIYFGLMGTFAGVFIGLLFFQFGLNNSSEGVTDETISNLIAGVLVSMSTSFIGLLSSTILNHYASNVKDCIGKEKNEFFDFIQNELLPTLGTSIVSALGLLRKTINSFVPSFNSVISNFQKTFDSCTNKFGESFARNVSVVSNAVDVMGKNMDKINDNIANQSNLLNTLRSSGVIETLNSFVEASHSFSRVTNSIHQLEKTHQEVFTVTKELVERQEAYNKSLHIPMSITTELNNILDRITNFEQNIEGLGNSINQTQLFSNKQIELIKEQINIIKKKQDIAKEYQEETTEDLKNMFEKQRESLKNMNNVFSKNIALSAEKFENELEVLNSKIKERRKDIINSLEEKFSLDQIKGEFSNLNRLEAIEKSLAQVSTDSAIKNVEKTLVDLSVEITGIKELLSDIDSKYINIFSRYQGDKSENSFQNMQKEKRGIFAGIFKNSK